MEVDFCFCNGGGVGVGGTFFFFLISLLLLLQRCWSGIFKFLFVFLSDV